MERHQKESKYKLLSSHVSPINFKLNTKQVFTPFVNSPVCKGLTYFVLL